MNNLPRVIATLTTLMSADDWERLAPQKNRPDGEQLRRAQQEYEERARVYREERARRKAENAKKRQPRAQKGASNVL